MWLPAFLSVHEQRWLAAEALAVINGPTGGFVPVVRGGGRMHVRMTCLGHHWNALTYRYGSARDDFDGRPVASVPSSWQVIACRAASEAGFTFTPDICIVNLYGEDGRMGLHRDAGESQESLARGAPVVSLSLGATARFLFGGDRRRDPVEALMLESGDGFVFGGPARLRYHGVSRILPDTSPAGVSTTGRINLTFRQR